jgi:methionine synthase II (cobalamin-independent)
VQFDEPLLPAALAGRLTGVTALSPVHPVDEAVAIGLLDHCVSAVGGEVLLHSCAAELPWKLLVRSSIQAVSVDVSALAAQDLDGLGEFVDSGRAVVLGVVPTAGSDSRPSVAELAGAAAAVIDRLGFSRAVLAERVGISPACGLAAATDAWARIATTLTQRTAAAIADDPEIPAR